jgi:dTMP kinase
MPYTTPSSGFLISFEGLEGSGKSTQIKILKKALTDLGKDVVLTREPGGTALAESLRQSLLSHDYIGMSARTELLLLMAARSDHIERVILPALERNQIVIVDRFIDASFAYQGFGREMGGQLVYSLHQSLGLWLRPHRSIFLDINLNDSFDRICARSEDHLDRIELESELFFSKVREGYLEIAKTDCSRYEILDAKLSVEQLHGDIMSIILKDLNEHNIS